MAKRMAKAVPRFLRRRQVTYRRYGKGSATFAQTTGGFARSSWLYLCHVKEDVKAYAVAVEKGLPCFLRRREIV